MLHWARACNKVSLLPGSSRAGSDRTCSGRTCEFGLEGLVSERRDRAYRAGASPNWVKEAFN